MRLRLELHSLQTRLLLIFLALNLLSVSGLIAWSAQRVQTANLEQAEHELEIQAHIVTDALREPYENWVKGTTGAGRSLDMLVLSYAESTGSRVTVLNPDQTVVMSSEGRIPQGRLEANRPELLAALRDAELHDIRADQWLGQDQLYVAAPISGPENKVEGLVQLATPIGPIYDGIHQTWLRLLGVGGLLLLLTAVVSLLLARQIARPVHSLTVTTEAIARGELDRRVVPSGPDETQRLGRAFNQMAERVQDMLARQKEFVANAAHELRSPLTGLRLRLEILQSQAGGNPELTHRYLAQMDRELGALQHLVERLLTLSAIDENEPAPRAPLDVAPLLSELADEMAPLAREANVRLVVSLPPQLPPLDVNADQFRIIVRNLLDNAIKYTPSGGQVTFAAVAVPDSVNLTVADTGIGIPPEALPHIFDRFYRVDKSRSQRRRGSGLGLALARTLVEAHQGRIEVESEPGVGSVFTVRLPVSHTLPADVPVPA